MNTKKSNSFAPKLVLFFVAVALTLGAVLLFRGMFSYDGIVSRVLAGIGGVLCAIVGAFGWLVLIAAVSVGGHRNLFLYDRQSKTNLPLEALTWPLVRERLAEHFRGFLSTSRRGYLPPQLVPLFMPYLLLVFIDSAPDSDWNKLFYEESALLCEMIEGLDRFGLAEPAAVLRENAPRYQGNPGRVKSALIRHRDAIESAILSHIREHIADFE